MQAILEYDTSVPKPNPFSRTINLSFKLQLIIYTHAYQGKHK